MGTERGELGLELALRSLPGLACLRLPSMQIIQSVANPGQKPIPTGSPPQTEFITLSLSTDTVVLTLLHYCFCQHAYLHRQMERSVKVATVLSIVQPVVQSSLISSARYILGRQMSNGITFISQRQTSAKAYQVCA